MSVLKALQRDPLLACGGEYGARTEEDLAPLAGDLKAPMELDRAFHLLSGLLRLTVEQGRLGQCMREGREDVGLARLGRDPAESLCAGAGLLAVAGAVGAIVSLIRRIHLTHLFNN